MTMGVSRTNEEYQSFLKTLQDALHEGRRTPLTAEEESLLYTCARAVGMWWIDDWLHETETKEQP